jgi:hypothetical protein
MLLNEGLDGDTLAEQLPIYITKIMHGR